MVTAIDKKIGTRCPGTLRRLGVACLPRKLCSQPRFPQPTGMRRVYSILISLGLAVLHAPGRAQADTWPFEPAADTFSAESWLDLRFLNERVAGESGFIRADAAGDFVRGNGEPIRFWAVNTEVGQRPFVRTPRGPQAAPDLARHARFLAKRGVNLVRLHRQVPAKPDSHPDVAFGDIDAVERDGIWRTVAAMKKEGIYSAISPYWAGRMKFAKGWQVAGGEAQSAYGLLFFDPALQAAYKSWLRQLLTEKNPHTGLALARDPSVALLQLQNEDSLLFWTVDQIQGPQRAALERRFHDFLTRKYGSLDTWRGEADDKDARTEGRIALRPLWMLTQAGGWKAALGDLVHSGRAVRLADQTEFYARTMFEFNRAMSDYVKRELGAGSLVNAGNWKTASAERLGDAERWSYTAGDVDAVNRYSGGLHQGPHPGWAIVEGDRYQSSSVLRKPALLPVNIKQTAGRPMLLTEGAWELPNAHASEAPFLVAAYLSLSGVDAYAWFTTADEGWAAPQSANGYLPSQGKWSFAYPDVLGNFPAAALAFRKGYVKRAAVASHERRSLDDLWQRRVPLVTEIDGFDPNRDAADAQRGAAAQAAPQAFLLGPVELAFGAAAAGVAGAKPAAPMSTPVLGGVVRSNTGELAFNAEQGWCTLDAPHAQGVAAHFNRAPTHALTDMAFTSRNAFGAALAVSLDGAPLRTSRRILLQYGTQSRPSGWREVPARLPLEGGASVEGWEIKSYGQAPWRVAKAALEVQLRNAQLAHLTVLDMNGMPLRTLPLERREGSVKFAMPTDAMYVVLH